MSSITSKRQRRLRLGLAVLGGLVFALGVLTVIVPTTAATSLGALVALLGNDYLIVAVIGVVALAVVAVVLVATGRSGVNQTAPPAPEGVYPVPRFGEEIDAFLSKGGFAHVAGSDPHEEIRSELRAVAVTTVMRDANCTREEAQQRIEAGTWTDDGVAATFLSEGRTPSLGTRLRTAFVGESPAEQAVRAAATEIAELDEEAVR